MGIHAVPDPHLWLLIWLKNNSVKVSGWLQGCEDEGQLQLDCLPLRGAQEEDEVQQPGPRALQQDVHAAGIPLPTGQEEQSQAGQRLEQILLPVSGINKSNTTASIRY